MSFLFIVVLLGFANAAYLNWQYRQHLRTGRKMVCPVGGMCEEVVGSSYGTTLGVKNEITGMIFYALLFVALLLTYVESIGHLAARGILVGSFIAAIFSTYLLIVQIFILRRQCSWCICATIINYALFGLEIAYLV